MSNMFLTHVVAGCVIQQDGRFLLVQEKLPKAYKLWNIPAGHVDEGEDFEQAALREAREETGFIVELERKLSVTHNDVASPVLHAYKAHVVSGEIKIDPNEILDVRWFTFAEIEQLQNNAQLRNDWVMNSIKLCL